MGLLFSLDWPAICIIALFGVVYAITGRNIINEIAEYLVAKF